METRRSGIEPIHLRGGRLRRLAAAGVRRALRHGARHLGARSARTHREVRALAHSARQQTIRAWYVSNINNNILL